MKNKRKKRVRRYYKNFKKSNFVFLNKILRVLSWLLPGLVIKRWMFTSAIGFLTKLLGLAIWTNLRPLYWLIEIFFWVMTSLTSILPVSLLGPLIFVIGLLLIKSSILDEAIGSRPAVGSSKSNKGLVFALRV